MKNQVFGLFLLTCMVVLTALPVRLTENPMPTWPPISRIQSNS